MKKDCWIGLEISLVLIIITIIPNHVIKACSCVIIQKRNIVELLDNL